MCVCVCVDGVCWREREAASAPFQFQSIVAVPALILLKEDECLNSSHIMFLQSLAAISRGGEPFGSNFDPRVKTISNSSILELYQGK